ncbi:hypothetical protein OEIGOIKO_05768 [Streptomyces chrestomyceticus JCM 4735]|uniref:Uncharacterized protein n=1 Tax=Streptomyces chrestomyceticus JCM 4735 TaxID=1306181 RepID=A0A7U9PZZ2_9ACTN|nr:hypothetical protein [Streptomyces chrestomyceticus]GCD37958.1 hypothetical protein OEIGOIKO_05768 [Streptomyces chrestomyceticus JCM 4735]
MAAQYPREDGRTLPDWSDLPLDTREHLATQTPYRLQTIMYATNVGEVPADHFAAAVADADRKLRQLLTDEPAARQYFGDMAFAGVAHETDPMVAAEREYYLCDALIEYGNQHHGSVWNLPVLNRDLYGQFKEQSQ